MAANVIASAVPLSLHDQIDRVVDAEGSTRSQIARVALAIGLDLIESGEDPERVHEYRRALSAEMRAVSKRKSKTPAP